MFESLPHNTSLQVLSLASNSVSDRVFNKRIRRCLASNTTLSMLGLQQNRLTNRTAFQIATVLLSPSCGLTHVLLTANTIGETGIIQLTEVAKQNVRLEQCCLADNLLPKNHKALTALQFQLLLNQIGMDRLLRQRKLDVYLPTLMSMASATDFSPDLCFFLLRNAPNVFRHCKGSPDMSSPT